MPESYAIVLAYELVTGQQFIAAQEKLRKIHYCSLRALLLVIQVKLDHFARKIIVGFDLGGPEPLVFCIIDEPLHLAGRKLFIIRAQVFQDALYHTQLIRVIENLESLG